MSTSVKDNDTSALKVIPILREYFIWYPSGERASSCVKSHRPSSSERRSAAGVVSQLLCYFNSKYFLKNREKLNDFQWCFGEPASQSESGDQTRPGIWGFYPFIILCLRTVLITSCWELHGSFRERQSDSRMQRWGRERRCRLLTVCVLSVSSFHTIISCKCDFHHEKVDAWRESIKVLIGWVCSSVCRVILTEIIWLHSAECSYIFFGKCFLVVGYSTWYLF